ncbi:hypothetical protein [Methanimicrococcus hacksteinii]|uniref:hypothetical protein n=1 Tax=Methanimicrococcus hacksteinii TaxID=3028293 RepID=UPI00298F1B2A|nr:hypothetical protein [Methanimicrococcus sp. At1]
MLLLPFASAACAPYASSHFYHIRSLRERGHRLPYCFCSAVTLLFPFAAATLLFPFHGCLAVSVNTVAALQTCLCRAARCARAASICKNISKSPLGF